jgi:hypothetical protein
MQGGRARVAWANETKVQRTSLTLCNQKRKLKRAPDPEVVLAKIMYSTLEVVQ